MANMMVLSSYYKEIVSSTSNVHHRNDVGIYFGLYLDMHTGI